MKSLITIFILLAGFNIVLTAQTQSNQSVNSGNTLVQSDSNSTFSDLIKISGQVGVYGELYTISGNQQRRRPSIGRLFFRPTITLFNNFNILFDILLSTEDSYARQRLNRLSLHPSWGWGKAHIGDFSHQFSQFTLNGPTITGGGLEIQYGIIRFELVGGRTQRAVNADLSNSFYARYLGGIKLGIGKLSSSYIDINIVRIKDDIKSLPQEKFQQNSSSGSQYRVTPKENLVTGINGKLDIADMFKIYGEISASVYSHDLFSNTIDTKDIPGFVNGIYKVRYSTNLDYAYNTRLDFKYDIFNAKVDYSVINPGYVSLGLTTNLNDRRTINFDAGVRLLKNKLIIRGNYGINNNNLLSQKSFTLTRTKYGASVNYMPINDLSLAVRVLRNIMQNDASEVEKQIKNTVSLYSINTTWRLSLLNLNHSLLLSFSNQQSKDYNIYRNGNDVSTNNIVFGIYTVLNQNWTISPRISFNITDIGNTVNRTTSTYGMTVSNNMLNMRLTNSLGLSYMNSTFAGSTIFTLQSGYKISRYDVIKFTLNSSIYFGKIETIPDFSEYRGSLSFVHNF